LGTVAFAWELGANLGHLSRLLGPAIELRRQGYDVVFVVCDTLVASRLLSAHDFPFLQAPTVPRSVWRERRATLNYSSLLAAYGYANTGLLRALLQAWMHLWRQIEPDVVVIDHSPTALLAVRALAIPAVQLGTGFFVPPASDPLPSLQPWRPVPAAELVKADAEVLQPINSVLQSFAFPGLQRMADLFADPAALLTTFAELDHYGARGGVTYVGPLAAATRYPPIRWSDRRERRIFAYLRPSMTGIDAVLNVLQSHRGQVICVLPDAPAAMRVRLVQSGVEVHAAPVDMRSALDGCDLVITYGGAATVVQSLLAGVPLLVMPQELEQRLTGRRVTLLGAGILAAEENPQGLQRSVEQLLDEPSFAAAARQFSSRHADFDNAAASNHVASVIAAAARFQTPVAIS
jgi:UDP:flavonoid glycosyltransferase YjiC (YdhE family)